MQKVKVSDGVELAYYIDDFVEPWIEEKDTIIMLHGCVDDSQVFKSMVPTLARRYRVIRIDERGMGESTMAPGSYQASTERFVQDVLDLVDHLGIMKFHLFAQSTGGIIGVSFALAHPDRLKSLILCQTPYRLSEELEIRYRLGEKSIGAAIKKYGFREWNKKVPGYRLFDLTKVDPNIVEWYACHRAKNSTEAAAGRYDWTFTMDLSDRIKEMAVPTLLIVAEGSYQTPLKMVDYMKKQNPNIRVKILEGVQGQSIHLTEPDMVAQTILDFIKTID